MKLLDEYFNKVKEILEKIEKTQRGNITKAAEVIVNAIEKGGTIYAFGATHSGIVADELCFRAGGLAPINAIHPYQTSTLERPGSNTIKLEKLKGYGTIIIEGIKITGKDVLIINSISGRNTMPVEMAIGAKKNGAKLIVITNMEYSKNVKSNHSSGERLFEVGPDVVIDNCGIFGDAIIEIKGMKQKVAPTSGISGCFIAQAVVVQAVEELLKRSIEPPIFMSANIDGGIEFNKKILDKYKSSIKYL